ncbi:MAG: HlyD family efflux transporter periplasmic adaptor subunit [Chloroflexi bacterium]|nr:HlyD family efflux transporter periplasmic adaptor subunit [Chloroflexota bacterium]
MENSLFRREVLDAYASRWIGDPRHGIGISWMYAAVVVISASLCILAVIFMCSYSSRGIVYGQIVPRAGILELTSTISGRVKGTHYRDGAHVQKGDVLFEISAELQPANGQSPAEVIVALHNAKQRTAAQVAREINDQSERKAAFDSKRLAVQSELGSIRHQIDTQNQLLATSNEILALYERSGTMGIVANVSIAERRQQLQQQQAQLAEYERQLHGKESELASLRLDIAAADAASAEKVMKLRSDFDDLNRQLLQLESSREVSIVAPVSGTLSAVQATTGQAVTQGQAIGTLLPGDSELIGVALVPSKLIGELKVGSTARIRLDSFPYARFGTLPARINTVSQGPVASSKNHAASDETGEANYRLELEIPQTLDGADGRTHELRPGMNFSAVLPLERRRIFEWILPHLMIRRSSDQLQPP